MAVNASASARLHQDRHPVQRGIRPVTPRDTGRSLTRNSRGCLSGADGAAGAGAAMVVQEVPRVPEGQLSGGGGVDEVVGKAEGDRADSIQAGQVIGGQLEAGRSKVVFELVQPPGADDRHDDPGAVAQPCDRDLGWSGAEVVGDATNFLDDVEGAGVGVGAYVTQPAVCGCRGRLRWYFPASSPPASGLQAVTARSWCSASAAVPARCRALAGCTAAAGPRTESSRWPGPPRWRRRRPSRRVG